MYQYPELIQFRALPGTASALHSLAEAEGKRVAEIIRELVAKRLQTSVAKADACKDAA